MLLSDVKISEFCRDAKASFSYSSLNIKIRIKKIILYD